ncbi:MAG: hypothetical protein ACUVQX_05205 [Candidatus Bathycorpusculaceae bacterium]
MRMKKKFLALSAITLILTVTFASILISSPVMAVNASLTGRIFDHGEDTDMDLLYNFLVVDVEVQVFAAGTYKVSITSLRDQYYNSLYYQVENETFLDSGTHNVSLSFNGIAIYAGKINVTMVGGISLVYQVGTAYYSELIPQKPLSQTYNYTLFDYGAVLTGTIYDEGIDTDGDGLFNYLQINAEVDVADEALYQLTVSGLQNVSDSHPETIYISNFTQNYLFPGVQNLTVWLYGPTIYASHAINISIINWIELYFVEDSHQYELNYTSYQPLSRPYRYDAFDTPAYFTGTIFDEGIDEEPNGKFDYLKVSVQVNITESGYYQLEVLDLLDNAFYKILVSDTLYSYFDVGIYLVNLTLHGPKIYMSNLNPRYINSLSIYTFVNGGGNMPTDRLLNIPLSKQYNYTDFESHAFLTGKISDMGVDTDGDGLFNYLAVGVEINVTEAGMYEIHIGDLMEKTDSTYGYLHYPQWITDYFNVGVQTVYLNYSGPRIAYDHFSPTNVSVIELNEQMYPYIQLGYIPSAPLSQKYDYTLFNAPLNNIQLNFLVYPNGTIGVDGTVNYTHMYPENMGPTMNASIDISTTGNVTTGSLGGSVVIPKQWIFGLPLDSITANFSSKYEGGLSNSTLNCVLFVPPEAGNTYPVNATDFNFVSLYKNGMLNVELWGETQIPSYETMFPFNATDLTILADYLNGELVGNITFHLIPGVPMLDVVVHFRGNKTDLYLTDDVNVTYGNYFGMEINATTLEQMLSDLNSIIPGPSGLVANMTWNLLECTSLNTTKIEWPDGKGADVQYNATIHGNFTFFFARLLTQTFIGGGSHEEEQTIYAVLESMFSSVENASLTLYYYQDSGIAAIDKLKLVCDVKKLWNKALELVPPTVPPESRAQVEAMLKIANATAYAIQDASFNATYSSTEKRLYLNAYLLSNATQLDEELKTILPETVPPELRPIFESYLDVTYCNLTYSETTVRYVNGTADFEMNWTLEGDFKAQLNHVKRFYIDYFNATTPWMLNWQLCMLNETEIDISNFNAEIKIGKDQIYLTFNGVFVKPPIDEIDFIRFKLYKWLNMTTAPDEPPREFEKLTITLIGGFNGTHTILLYAPDTVPPPDTISLDYKNMTWQNVTLSSLKDMRFHIAYQGVIYYLANTYYVPIFTNSTVKNFAFDPTAKSISFNVTGETGTGFCNITIPKALLRAALNEWVVKIDGLTLPSANFTVTENAEYAFIYLNYTHSEHKIEIVGTWVVAEFQPTTLLMLLIMLSLIATIITVKQRKKLNSLKIKYQNTIHTFTEKFHQLKI